MFIMVNVDIKRENQQLAMQLQGEPVEFEDYKGRFTLGQSKSRGRGIEWPNFVESSKTWAEKNIL